VFARTSTWSRRMIVVAVMAATSAAALSVAATPASATIRFCAERVCIGSGNGCIATGKGGPAILADDGDSFISASGQKWTCKMGHWVITNAAQAFDIRGPVIGVGEFYQGPPPADPCDLSPTFKDVVAACVSIG
jgi:hypothetical protein